MAIVLVIDDNADGQKKQFDSVKGLDSYYVAKMDEALEFLKKDQFDIVLCQVPRVKDEVDELMATLNAHQAVAIKLFWVVIKKEDLTEELVEALPKEKILIKPVTEGDIGINPVLLMDQMEIDNIFD